MKPVNFFFLLIMFMSMIGIHATAHDIAMANSDGVTIYYVWTNDNTELAVSYRGRYHETYINEYSGNVAIPQSVTYNGTTYSVTSIGNGAFHSCSNLTSVTIPNSVTSIDYSAFSYCSGLTSVTIGNSVTSIGDNAFEGCFGLTSVTIPNSVTSIGNFAFLDCPSLTSITIPNSVTSIGYSAFGGCSGLTEVHFNAISCTTMGSNNYSVFSGCSSLTTLSIGDNVQGIPAYAFYGCSSLTSVTIPNSVTSIGEYAFAHCYNLESVIIGTGVLTIGSIIFASHRPAKVVWLTNTPPSGYTSAAGIVNYVANNLYTQLDNKTEYPFLSSLFEVGGVKYVPVSPSERTCDAIDCAYDNKIISLQLSNKVTYKGVEMTLQNMRPYLFHNNYFLEHIELALEDTLKRVIPACAFEGCANVKKMVIPNNITSIGESALAGCSSLTDLKIGSNVETIYEYAFAGCKSLPVIRIPRAVTDIKNSVFYQCTGLKTVIMDDRDKVLNLGSNRKNNYDYGNPLFSDCPLDSVYIGGNISYNTNSNYGYSPFYRNTSLRTVVITDKETEISENEFYGCTNLQDVKIGDGVEKFGDWAFSGCSSLKNFSFGMSVETIGKEAFSDCTAMERIYSRSPQPPVCGSQALDDINKWNCVLTVPAGNKAAYQAADQWKEFFFVEEGEAVNKYINITIEKSEGGKVLVNGKETPEQIKKGNDVELQFIPDEGYSLKQVLLNSDDVTAKVADGKYTVTGANVDLSVKVTFGVNQYTLTYLVDGEEYKTMQVDYKATITPEPAPVKEGHTFSGWSEIPETMPAHDVTVNGTFSVNSYTLTYLIDDEVYKTMEVVYGSSITPEAAPTKEGYTFSGWSEIPKTMPAHDVIVTGTFSINKYLLTYIVDGKEYKTYEVEYEASIIPEEEPAKEGYTFSGWSEIPETMPARNVTVNGTFSINSYTLTYMIDEEVYKQVVYEYGATITPEPQPEGDYVSFEWVGVPETMPAHDVTVTAVYETGIAEIMMMAQQGQLRIYSPNGKLLSMLQKGLNIVVLQDGTTKKVVVK